MAGSRREIWRLSWPVMLSQVLVTLVGLVDIAMVGRIGPKAQAAVGYASQFFALAQSALFAIGFACVAVMARAIGGRDLARARAALAGSLVSRSSGGPRGDPRGPRRCWRLSAAPDVSSSRSRTSSSSWSGACSSRSPSRSRAARAITTR
jgi:hypothetical protein